VVVTGVSVSAERLRSPVPTIALRRQEMLQSAGNNVVEALTRQPGVDQVTTGSGISKPIIRGLGYNRVVVLRNGIRQEGQQWGDEHGVELDEFEVDQVEIVKGPGSLMYGSDAMAGVVNFITPHPALENTLNAEALVSYHTNNGLVGTSLMQSGNVKGFNWLNRFSYKKAGNYSNAYDGFVYNSGFEEINGSGHVGLNRRWGHAHLHWSTYNQNVGLVEGERDSLGHFVKHEEVNDSTEEEIALTNDTLRGYQLSLEHPFQKVNHQRISLSNAHYIGTTKLTFDGGWQYNRRREFHHAEEAEAELDFKLTTFNGDLKYLIPFAQGFNVSLGTAAQHQLNEIDGHEYLIPAYTQTDIGAFVYAQKQFDKLFIGGGVRYDQRLLQSESLLVEEQHDDEPGEPVDTMIEKFAAFEKEFGNVSASLGASYKFTNAFVIRVNGSRGFRAPNLAELASNGMHEGTFRFEIGNQNLKSETATQLDIGFTRNGEHVSFDLSTFYNRVDNYIYLRKLESVFGGDSLPEPDAPAFKYVQGNAILFGGEATVDIHPHPFDWLHFKNSFSIVRGELLNQTDSTRNLPFIPAPKWNSELRAHTTKPFGFFKNAFAEIDGTYYFAQELVFSAYETETATLDYFLLDVSVGSDVLNRNNKTMFSLYLSLNNALNTSYQSHLSRLKYAPENPATGRRGVYNTGRNFSVKLIVPITMRLKTKVK
ncbi:MAG TPA: TonB-dependent receptor, partial [Chitinophagales bacterium]|nr:TonB-dependent receptor [Chitinophagales bacterium]